MTTTIDTLDHEKMKLACAHSILPSSIPYLNQMDSAAHIQGRSFPIIAAPHTNHPPNSLTDIPRSKLHYPIQPSW